MTDHGERYAEIQRLAELLRAGGLVAFPTETVYGLGANALDADAVARVFAAKGRPATVPLIVHLAAVEQLPIVTSRQSELALRLAQAFWPGPLTLVLPRASAVPDAVTAGLDTVGVRVPAHPLARALIAAAGVPLAAPSANPFTRISPTTAAHVRRQLGDRVDAVLDGGPTEVGIESTVVDASGERAVLLRPGGVSVAELEAVVGPVQRPTRDGDAALDAPQASPGMSERHYSPRARLIEVERDSRGQLVLSPAPGEASAWGLVRMVGGDATPFTGAAVDQRMPQDVTGYARRLFAALHELDEAGCEVAYVERLPAGPEWEAVADRLRRAGLRAADRG
ncbi:MAG: L-threonylcarbamoyladenylate synthase [bacterium]|nr:L-threonylcarbamoyladenylate synthase [bacterium]